MDADIGEIGQRVRQVGQLDPVILDVLPRGEMAVTAIVAPRDMREAAQLLGGQRAVGNGDAEHVRVQLQVNAVLQAQHLEFVLGELAGKAALHLVAEFGDALVEQRAVEFVVCVHDREPLSRDRQQLDGETFHPDLLAQISRHHLAIPEFNGRDVGADRPEIVGYAFGQQRTRIVGGAYNRGVRDIRGPAILAGPPDHDAIGSTVRGHHRGPRDLDFLLQRRGHSAASSRFAITSLSSKLRHGAECATTSPMMRMAGPPSICFTNSGS
ncbi:hypothetical protein ES707_09082 [subsurface metagenome]